MIRWDADAATVSVHRVVQEILRTRQPDQQQCLTAALQLLDHARPSVDADDVRTWPAWEPLRPHVAFATAEAADRGIAVPTSRLMGQLGMLLWAKALHNEAEQLDRRALELDTGHYGADSPEVAVRLNNLAQTLQATNRLAEAEPLMRHALAIWQASYGDEHPHTQTVSDNLAVLLKQMGQR
jgi:hypothetical protein